MMAWAMPTTSARNNATTMNSLVFGSLAWVGGMASSTIRALVELRSEVAVVSCSRVMKVS